MTPAQLDTLQSLPYQFQAIWNKLGGKYADMTEADLHRLAHEKHISARLRTSWREYEDTEVRRLIGFLLSLLSAYKKQWTDHWQAEKARREQSLFDDARIAEECYTYEQCVEYLRERSSSSKVIERFVFERTINHVGYWRKRDTPVRYLTEREALAEYDACRFADRDVSFHDAYKLVVELGWNDPLFVPQFSFTSSERT